MWWEVTAMLLGLILPILADVWSQQNRRRRYYEAAIEDMDGAIARGDAERISRAFNELRPKGDGDPGGPDGQAAP